MKIYLDVCCLNRPFDDQAQDRIRIESESILTILNYCLSKKWQAVGSEVVDIEVSMIPDNEHKQKVSILAIVARARIIVDEKVKNRAIELENLGFKVSFKGVGKVKSQSIKAGKELKKGDTIILDLS